jgi:hypothetical protein
MLKIYDRLDADWREAIRPQMAGILGKVVKFMQNPRCGSVDGE